MYDMFVLKRGVVVLCYWQLATLPDPSVMIVSLATVGRRHLDIDPWSLVEVLPDRTFCCIYRIEDDYFIS